MAALNYFELMKEIQTILVADVDVNGLLVGIEQEPLGPADHPIIQIFLENRTLIPGQRIAAGRRTDYQINFSIWCYGFGLTTEDACSIRDDLIGRTELALMQNRTLNGKVVASYPAGGAFTGLDGEGGFFRAGEVKLAADAHATY